MSGLIGVISGLINMSIRLYIMWYVLTKIGATELPMFLFWVSIPFSILVLIIAELMKKNK